MRQNQADTVTMEEKRGLKDGDVANIDFTGSLDGKPVKDLIGSDFLVQVGKSETVPGFEDNIIGMKAGDSKGFDLPFPEDFFKPQLAGQVVHFDVDLKEIRVLQLPELDDEFAKDQGEFANLDELKGAIRENLTRVRASDSEKALRQNLTQRLAEDNVFEVPPSLVDRELRRIIQEYGDNMIESGLDNDKVREAILENEDHLKKTAAETIRLLYVIKAIGEKEGMEATEEEVRHVITGMAGRMGKSTDELMEEYTREGALEEVAFNVIREKVFKKVIDSAKIKIVSQGEEKPRAKKKSVKKEKEKK